MSTDSRFSHKIWQEEELSKMVEGGVPYPMLSDAGGRIGQMYGVYDEAGGVDIRGRFLIDPDGVIQAMEVLTPPVGRNVSRADPPGTGLPARARDQGGRSHTFWLGAGQADTQSGSGPGGQGLDSLDNRSGVLGWSCLPHRGQAQSPGPFFVNPELIDLDRPGPPAPPSAGRRSAARFGERRACRRRQA